MSAELPVTAADAAELHRAERYLLGLELFGMRFGLDRMLGLMERLGQPQRRFASRDSSGWLLLPLKSQKTGGSR